MLKRALFFLLWSIPCLLHAQSSTAVGDAFATGNNCYTITSAQNWQLGAVWFNEQLNLANPFEITLDINFGSDDNGADGVVFIMQQVGLNAIGNPGGGMGFVGFAPSLGIEMDTYYNGDLGDIQEDHMGVFANGVVNHNDGLNLAGPVPVTPFGGNIEDGQDHIFKLEWDPGTQILSIYFDCELRIQMSLDLVNVIFGGDPEVYWGFSGATGGEDNLQQVCISEFALGLEPEVTVCDGESIPLGVVGAEQGTYSWEPSTYLDNPNIANPICSPDENISYIVTFTDVCGEEITLDTDVEVISLEFELPESYSFCENETEEIDVDNPNNYNLFWDGESAVFPMNLTAGAHELLIESAGCEQQFTTEVEVLSAPQIPWQEEYSACEDEFLQIDAFVEGAEYQWQDASNESTFSSNNSEDVHLIITGENGCISEFQSEFIIHPLPSPHLPEQVDLCQGEFYELQPIEGTVIEWNTGSTQQAIEVGESGEIIVTVESDEGCLNSDSSLIQVLPAPSILSLQDAEICEGEIFELNLDLEPEWVYFLNGQELLEASTQISEGGTYLVLVSSEDGICHDETQFQISEIQAPTFELAEIITICEGDVFELNVDGLVNYTTYWNGEEQAVFRINTPGVYELLAENNCGSEVKEVEVFDEQCSCSVYTPNAFTPDDDGTNDLFKTTLDCDLNNFQFLIFNRWGELVYTSKDPKQSWNGSMNGSDYYVQEDVYFWHLSGQAHLPNGIIDVLESGFVTVIR